MDKFRRKVERAWILESGATCKAEILPTVVRLGYRNNGIAALTFRQDRILPQVLIAEGS